MKKYLLLGLLSTLILSCNVHKDCIGTTSEKEVFVDREVIVRDTVFQIEKDSSSFTGRLRVDTMGNVTIQPTQTAKGSSLKAPSVTIDRNNNIRVDCYAEAQELFAQWKEEHVTKTTTEKITIPVPVPAEISGFKVFLMWVGGIVIVLGTLVLGGVLIYKYKLKTKA
jgi:hypothetical protein